MRLPDRPLRRVGVELFAISFVVLFQELTLIRWLPGQVRVLAYFPNLILLSAFLGLGLGCLRSARRSLLWLWPASLLVLAGAGWVMSRVAFTQNSVTEHLWLLYYDLGDKAPVIRRRPPAHHRLLSPERGQFCAVGPNAGGAAAGVSAPRPSPVGLFL